MTVRYWKRGREEREDGKNRGERGGGRGGMGNIWKERKRSECREENVGGLES